MCFPRKNHILSSRLLLGLVLGLGTTTVDANFDASVRGFCSVDGERRLDVSASNLEPEVTVFECISAGVPGTHGLVSLSFAAAGSECSDFSLQISQDALTTVPELATWGITQLAELCKRLQLAAVRHKVQVAHEDNVGIIRQVVHPLRDKLNRLSARFAAPVVEVRIEHVNFSAGLTLAQVRVRDRAGVGRVPPGAWLVGCFGQPVGPVVEKLKA